MEAQMNSLNGVQAEYNVRKAETTLLEDCPHCGNAPFFKYGCFGFFCSKALTLLDSPNFPNQTTHSEYEGITAERQDVVIRQESTCGLNGGRITRAVQRGEIISQSLVMPMRKAGSIRASVSKR